MRRAKVLLADDHRIVAEGLAAILQRSFELVGIVSDGAELVEAARLTKPDVIVTDVSMPGMSGLEALKKIRAEGNKAKVLFLTMHSDAALAAQTLRAGASGYVLKQTAGEDLVIAIRAVLAGQVYLANEIASDAVTVLAGAKAPVERLTARQHDVLRLVVEGKTMKQVAAELKLSRRTVESYKYDMMESLGVQTSGELIQYAFRHGLAGQ